MLEVDTPEIVRTRLIDWLKEASESGDSANSHTLHLWGWEVKLLLAALSPKPLMTSYRFGSVGDAEHPGRDAPLPGNGWVPEKDR